MESQRERGFRIVTGRWLVEGNPQVVRTFILYVYGKLLTLEYNNILKYQVILFDVGSAAVKMNEWKQEL